MDRASELRHLLAEYDPLPREFARINIPVLITIGYYAGGPGAGVYYFSQHEKYNPAAEHYLLIGPYGHLEAQYGPFGLLGNSVTSLSGLKLDPVAVLDLTDLRYQWFDYVFKNAPRPAFARNRLCNVENGIISWGFAATPTWILLDSFPCGPTKDMRNLFEELGGGSF